MALIGRYNSLQVVKHTDFGLYLDGGADGEILLPKRYIPKDTPSEVEDWLNVFIYLDSSDKLIATTEKPKVQVGEFAIDGGFDALLDGDDLIEFRHVGPLRSQRKV